MLNVQDFAAEEGQNIFGKRPKHIRNIEVRRKKKTKIKNLQLIAGSIKWHKHQVDRVKTHATITCQKPAEQKRVLLTFDRNYI